MTRKHWLGLGALALPFVAVAAAMGIFITVACAMAADDQDTQRRSAWSQAAQGVPASVTGIPPVMLSAYTTAAANIGSIRPRCTGMRWQVVAGIAAIESNHAAGHTITPNGDITPHILGPRLDGSGIGGNTTPVYDTDHGRWDDDTQYDRAVGPTQFLPSTWEGGAGQDGNHDGIKDPNNAYDAALATAAYLCGNGASTTNLTDQTQLRQAILRYNHSGSYANDVLDHIRQYDQLGATNAPGTTVGGSAGAVIQVALAQRGLPYIWGGGDINGPTGGGFDCSGLLVYAFHKAANITLPRTSQEMRGAGQHIDKSAMQPGDLIVFNNDGNWGHVGLYLGDNQMINAPRPGKNVETTTLDYWQQFPWEVRRVVFGA